MQPSSPEGVPHPVLQRLQKGALHRLQNHLQRQVWLREEVPDRVRAEVQGREAVVQRCPDLRVRQTAVRQRPGRKVLEQAKVHKRTVAKVLHKVQQQLHQGTYFKHIYFKW